MTLELDYDVNRIASIELEVRVLWDPTLARIALRFGNAERGTARRISIADNVFLDVDDERLVLSYVVLRERKRPRATSASTA